MKNYFKVIILATFLLASCKKEQVGKTSNIPATPAQLAVVADSLRGSWGYLTGSAYFQNVSFIPTIGDFPLNKSIIFNGTSSIKTVDYDGNLGSIPYTLSGVDNAFYLNIQKSATDSRKLKIIKLTSDSLVVQNTITGTDTSTKIVFTERLFRINPIEAAQNEFKITFSNPQMGPDTLSIFITPKGGTERLVTTTSNFSEYTFSYFPTIGDHIRTQINFSYYNTPTTILSYYKGLPYGDCWKYYGVKFNYNQNWDINY